MPPFALLITKEPKTLLHLADKCDRPPVTDIPWAVQCTRTALQCTAAFTFGLLPVGGGTLSLPTAYKFHEGYTNAVKRPILMKDLLLV